MYQTLIRDRLAMLGRIGVDPRHVEGFMRVEYSALDGLRPSAFDYEIKRALDSIDAEGVDIAERVAKSYGL